MALQIGAVAPDFEAETTEGRIRFHDWIGDSWALLFSHPKDFTPVCTTELGALARLKPEFDKRGVKLMGLSRRSRSTITPDGPRTSGKPKAPRRTIPMIGDTDFNVSKLYDMLPAATSGDPSKRTAADNQTVRNVFIIGPDKKIKLVLVYPMTTGRNFQEILRVIDLLQMTAKHRVATPADWKQGEDVIIAGSVSRRRGQGRSIQPDGRRRSPTCGSCRSRSDGSDIVRAVIPGRCEASNPEFRDSGFASRPGMTVSAERFGRT